LEGTCILKLKYEKGWEEEERRQAFLLKILVNLFNIA